jgi:hypothetical protein
MTIAIRSAPTSLRFVMGVAASSAQHHHVHRIAIERQCLAVSVAIRPDISQVPKNGLRPVCVQFDDHEPCSESRAPLRHGYSVLASS